MTELNAYIYLEYMHSLQEATQIITSTAAIRSMCVQLSFVIIVSNNTCSNVIEVLVLDSTFMASWSILFGKDLLLSNIKVL